MNFPSKINGPGNTCRICPLAFKYAQSIGRDAIKAYFRGMKWMFSLLLAGFLFSACDNELVVIDNWKDIPVVWGFVSKSDTAHYIRVEKAFLDPNTSAYVIAQIPDSIYYSNATVTIKRIASGDTYTLEKVDGTLEGYPREPGDFATTPNYLYKIKGNEIDLVAGEKYQFSLVRNGIETPVTAETIILPKPVIRNPSLGTPLFFRTGVSFNFDWLDMPDAGMFDIHMRFHYTERNSETGGEFVPQTIEWVVTQGLIESGYKMNGEEFYKSIDANIEDDPTATRIIGSADIVVWCGGKEMEEYINVLLANTGITSTQDFPEYTNLSEGNGIFTSRNYTDNMAYPFHPQTIDSLKDGSITGHLNFQ